MGELRRAIMNKTYTDDYGCMLWTGATNRVWRKREKVWAKKGPRMNWEGKTVNPRRELWELDNHERLPQGSSLVATECGEPLCINPDHMEVS